MEKTFQSTPNGVLTVLAELLPCSCATCLVVVHSSSQSTASSNQSVLDLIPRDYWFKHNMGTPSPTLEGSGVKSLGARS